MPLYTAITQDGTVSAETKPKIAEEITRIHTSVMKVPKDFVRVVFLSYPNGSGFTGGETAPAAALNCVLRSGHTQEEKTEMLQQRKRSKVPTGERIQPGLSMAVWMRKVWLGVVVEGGGRLRRSCRLCS